MRPTRILVAGFVSVVMLTAPSCVLLNSPISDPLQAEPDVALFGSWQRAEDGAWPDCLHVGGYRPTASAAEGVPRGLMRVEVVEFSRDGDLVDMGDARLLCFPTRIADDRYLNITAVSPEVEQSLLRSGWKEKPSLYAVLRYRIEGDTLSLEVLDLRRKRKADWRDELKSLGAAVWRFGTLADSKNLVKLLASDECDEFFRGEGRYTRMNRSEQPLAAAGRSLQ